MRRPLSPKPIYAFVAFVGFGWFVLASVMGALSHRS